jgi:hypothetical protein
VVLLEEERTLAVSRPIPRSLSLALNPCLCMPEPREFLYIPTENLAVYVEY